VCSDKLLLRLCEHLKSAVLISQSRINEYNVSASNFLLVTFLKNEATGSTLPVFILEAEKVLIHACVVKNNPVYLYI
jgi:hypothetical protein